MQKYPTDEELYEIVKWAMNRLSYQFAFGYYAPEDLIHWAYLKAKKVLPKWDQERSLNKFLSWHLKNQLCNLKRKLLERIDPPCNDCPFNAYVNGKCTKFDKMDDCDLYRKWKQRNSAKKSIMQPIPINEDSLSSCSVNSANEAFENADFLERIHVRLSPEDQRRLADMRCGTLNPNQCLDLIERIQQWLKEKVL